MRSVIVIDSTVSDYQSFLANLPANAEILLLDEGNNGVAQLANYLTGQSGTMPCTSSPMVRQVRSCSVPMW